MQGKYTKRIDDILKEKKKTWTWVSQQLGVTQRTVSNWKTNDYYPLVHLDTLAECLGITVAELLDLNNQIGRQQAILEKLREMYSQLGEQLEDVESL